jgi:3-oxoacyl-[acyl-carrier protein] reductase
VRLANRAAVITGGGSGMGAASAIMFAKEGAKVMVADIDAEQGQATVDAVRANGGTALFVRTDVSKEDEVNAMVEQAIEAFGGLSIVFNVAGIPQLSKPFETITVSEWERIMAVNVMSIFLTAKAASAALRKAGNGVILNTGSVGGLRPRPGSVCYSASKGAVQAITTALAIELAPDNIRVCCINPGPTDTPMLPKFMTKFTPEVLDVIATGTALGKMVTSEDIAYAAVFLASDEASKITGIDIKVDSGLWINRGAT